MDCEYTQTYELFNIKCDGVGDESWSKQSINIKTSPAIY